MGNLRLGDSGAEVRALQQRLAALGYDPDGVDGDFGPGTRKALMAFQAARGLLVDGEAGPRTQTALGLADDATLPSVLDRVTVDQVVRMFPAATPRANIAKYLPNVLEGLKRHGLVDRRMVLMALATIRAESEGFAPIAESVSKYNSSPGGRPFDLYDGRAALGNGPSPDGARFKGRGFIQLTGRANYAKYGPRVGVGDRLVAQPELANDPQVAADLLAVFLADQEVAIKQALVARDFVQARKRVNGGSHGLDRFIDTYLAGEPLIA